ncbi:uncharacterized protein PAC_19249 [Phialocephala subalpina]|uniref:Uncharacterized protein n=1 Tax=Phialocephala subalpina TaxID=576137 RepID=A0A1L7XWI5_9HELO|nr:uncharacterized protein PAC_19249 [Phialocephala subalpina]
MFKAHRDELLDIARFYANEAVTSDIYVLEAWKYQGVDTCDESNFRHIVIEDGQVQDWLDQKDEFAVFSSPTAHAVLEGSIRLLFCDRTDYRPPGFGMSKESYLAVERDLHLPNSTLESIFSYQGSYSKHLTPASDDSSEGRRLCLTMKVAQKMPIANYALSMSYDPVTKITTALIHGSYLHTVLPTMRNSLWHQPLGRTPTARHLDYAHLRLPNDPFEITQSSQIIAHLKSCVEQWTHPLFLPILLVYNYRIRSHLFAWDLDDQVVDLERQTGVVFAGRTVRTKETSVLPESIPREKIRDLTKYMHTLMAEIIFFERVVEWTSDCNDWLESVADELYQLKVEKDSEILEMIQFMRSDAKNFKGLVRALKERVQSQINVLYSYIAQIDNSINAKIAVSSARDSSAMKTLALITTVFLPGTYVATLFSMLMFTWSSSTSSPSSSSDPIVSPKFWIYWAVTIPLTLLTMLIWRIWWVWQERIYEKESRQASGETKDLPLEEED